MVDEIVSENLKIVAHHEAAHAFMNTLFRRPIEYIKLCCTNGLWHGETKRNVRQDGSDLNNCPGLSGGLRILFNKLEFQYSRYSGLFKIEREECVIAYAGIIAENLLYEQMGIEKDAMQSPENRMDLSDAKKAVMRVFLPEEQEKELEEAGYYAREILSNPVAKEMVENLARELIEGLKWPTLSGSPAHFVKRLR